MKIKSLNDLKKLEKPASKGYVYAPYIPVTFSISLVSVEDTGMDAERYEEWKRKMSGHSDKEGDEQ